MTAPRPDANKCRACGGKCRFGRPLTGKYALEGDPHTEPDWSKKCEVCGARPVVPITGLCGPCTWGESETANGNW